MAIIRPFAPLWKSHQENRAWAAGVAPKLNRCALVLSKTLGIKPGSGENSLADVDDLAESAKGQAWLSDYFVQAQQLADRLHREWGAPTIWTSGKDAQAAVAGKKGVIFFEDAYGGWKFWKGKYIDHIDLWDGEKTGSGHMPFEAATRVWFWEIIDATGDFPTPDPNVRHV